MPRGRNTITAYQRSIVISLPHRARSRSRLAKQRFAELEGIPSWQIHPSIIEVGLLDSTAAASNSRMLRPVNPMKA